MAVRRLEDRSLLVETYGFLLPGIFLACLGFGNFSVGIFKENQYQQALKSLAGDNKVLHLSNSATNSSSPFSRLKFQEEETVRYLERQKKALTRIDLYRLITFGGKLFLALSIPFLLSGALLYFSLIRQQYSKDSNQKGNP